MNSKIKAIILDVDGVIVGEKIGYNSPNPHPNVIAAMKSIQNSGTPISLCTAKPHFAIGEIIKDANLDNAHITDGGGVIINPIDDIVFKKNIIPTNDAIGVLKTFLSAGVYTEFYTVDNYFIEKSQLGEITKKHSHVIQSQPKRVESLVSEAKNAEITKIMPIAIDEDDKLKLQRLFEPFIDRLILSWGVHPVILPLQFGIITAPGISKKQGAIEISKATNIPLKNTLGVGDSESDWQFMELCGYVAVMGNAKQKFKDLVTSKKGNQSFIAPSVEENGILKVFEHFKLI